MLELLTGAGLAAAAGLNAYVPLLLVGLLSAHTGLLQLPQSWQWLENGWVQLVLLVLLVIEVVADKVPAVDSINDIVQTVVRPAAGGIVFGSGAVSQTVTVSDPAGFLASQQWVPILAGVVIALIVHGAKAFARPAANVASGGLAAPVLSAMEDTVSLLLSFVAILVPVLVIVGLIGLAVAAVMLLRRRRWRALSS